MIRVILGPEFDGCVWTKRGLVGTGSSPSVLTECTVFGCSVSTTKGWVGISCSVPVTTSIELGDSVGFEISEMVNNNGSDGCDISSVILPTAVEFSNTISGVDDVGISGTMLTCFVGNTVVFTRGNGVNVVR